MNIILLTSNELRHLYFAKRICEVLDVKLIISEAKNNFSKDLHEKEKNYFKNIINWPSIENHLFLESGEINNVSVELKLKQLSPDYIFTFGCGLLKPSIFNIPRYGCINIHTGLVQYYRGVDSTMWAIIDNRLDLIGSTIHYIDNSIDGGDIIDQRKIDLLELSSSDTLDDVFIKNCIIGIELLIENIDNILSKKIYFKKDKATGKLYQNKDKNKESLLRAESNLRNYFNKINDFNKIKV